jgi:hypothetical protein
MPIIHRVQQMSANVNNMQDDSQVGSDEQTVAHVMDWLLEKIQLKGCMQSVFDVLACNPHDIGITIWHASACSTARILPVLGQYAVQVMKSLSASIRSALEDRGKSSPARTSLSDCG